MAEFGIKFFPSDGIILTIYYAGESLIFDFQLFNPNHWEYEDHWRWIKRAYADYLPPVEYDESIPF